MRDENSVSGKHTSESGVSWLYPYPHCRRKFSPRVRRAHHAQVTINYHTRLYRRRRAGGAATLPACSSKQAAEIAGQAVYDDWVLLGLKDTAKGMRKYFTELHDGVDDESRALKRKLMRAFRVGEIQMRLCRAKPLGSSADSAPIVVS